MRHELVIPALALERAALQLIRAVRADQPLALAYATAERIVTGDRTIWYADEFDDPLTPLRERHSFTSAGQTNVSLWWAHSQDGLPNALHEWPRWLRSHPPHNRTLRLQDSTVHLVLRADGTAIGFVMTRGGQSQSDWSALDLLRLPGPRMRRLDLANPRAGGTASVAARAADLVSGRFSRLAGASGADVLASSQDLVFLVAGAGRTGSAVAHTLARNGYRQILLDPDIVETHNASDGDLLIPGLHDGLPKAHSVAKAARPLLRPGAWIDARQLDVRSDAAQVIAQEADILVSCLDNDKSRLACARLARKYRLPQLDLGVGMPLHDRGAGIDVRLTLPGSGCLMCVGGLASHTLDWPDRDERTQTDFGVLRRGSARSLSVTAANLGIRLLEQLFDGRVRQSRFVQLTEDASTGFLRLDDSAHSGRLDCLFCGPGRIHTNPATRARPVSD